MENGFVQLKPGTLLAPVPAVMVSCARAGEKPNIVTLAWVGTVNSEPPMCSVSVRKERFSHGIIRETGEFVINLVGEDQLKATDFCGVKSGRDVDKFAACGLTPAAVEGFAAPAIAECPLYLACRVTSVQDLGSHDLFLGKIERVGVKKEMMDASGRLDFGRMKLIAYNHGVYYALGGALGFFGYSVAAPEVLERRMREIK
ncbi:MAG: flavin reductase family protein [Clostridiales bacterium]|nr:flavin reductase family protein [Clostridiales bacterium]